MKAKEFIVESTKSFISEGTTVDEKPYKGYTVRIVDNRPKTKGFVGIAFKEKKGKVVDTFLVKVPKATPAEVEKELSDYVDSKVSLSNNSLTQFKSGQITMFFNTILSKEIFGPDAVLYADVENVNGKPVLIISTEDQGGMHKVYDRNINKESGRGTGIFLMPRKNAINAGLTLSRYDLGREIDYGVPEVEAFELKWNSDVIPGEPLKLGGPGLTVSPPRKGQEMDESLLMNEVEEILQEAKKTMLKIPKPRDPNWQTMQAKGASGAGGKHIDKKRADKQGNVKHKNKFNYKQDDWSADFERRMKKGVEEDSAGEELANEVYAEFERMYPNLARRANERMVHAAIMDVLNYGGDNDPAALAQDVARAVKRNMQGVAEGEGKSNISPSGVKTNMYPTDDDYEINYGKKGLVAKFRKSKGLDVKTGSKKVSEAFQDKKSLEQRLYNYEAAVNRAREATRVIKNADMHMEIIGEILELAKKTGIEETEFKYQIEEVYSAVSNLQREVYKLVEPFTDAVQVVQDTIDELDEEEWQRKDQENNQ